MNGLKLNMLELHRTTKIMKVALTLIIIFFCYANLNAQSKTISRGKCEKAFSFAVSETNAVYPHIFEVITSFIKDGKTIRKVTVVNENETSLHHRIKITTLADGKETNKYQVNLGYGNVFCSDDATTWKPSKYECYGPTMFYGPRNAGTAEYSVIEKKLDGKPVKIYREYSVFAPLKEGGKREFREKVSTIDSYGLFITVEDSEGTLDPKTVMLTRKQTWTLKAKIEPVVSPIKVSSK
ncbi:MAG: hypothetical protein M3Q99_05925 [Acidobacteriota bacterium]|nr:hypothetical protein [Acidobacteriota bacterium]